MLKTNYDKAANTLTCVFAGKMDTVNSQVDAGQFEQALLALRDSRADGVNAGGIDNISIVFDMREVVFVASAFLRICIQAAKKAQNGSFKIMNTSPVIQKTLKLARLDQYAC